MDRISSEKRSKNMSNKTINEIYNFAMKNGALGGKLIGAGGGGFLLFYANSPNQLRKALTKKKLEEVKFKFDTEGVKQIFWENIMELYYVVAKGQE